MLRSNLFFSPAAYRQRIKSPVEFAVGIVRGLEGIDSRRVPLGHDLAALGQVLYAAARRRRLGRRPGVDQSGDDGRPQQPGRGAPRRLGPLRRDGRSRSAAAGTGVPSPEQAASSWSTFSCKASLLAEATSTPCAGLRRPAVPRARHGAYRGYAAEISWRHAVSHATGAQLA